MHRQPRVPANSTAAPRTGPPRGSDAAHPGAAPAHGEWPPCRGNRPTLSLAAPMCAGNGTQSPVHSSLLAGVNGPPLRRRLDDTTARPLLDLVRCVDAAHRQHEGEASLPRAPGRRGPPSRPASSTVSPLGTWEQGRDPRVLCASRVFPPGTCQEACNSWLRTRPPGNCRVYPFRRLAPAAHPLQDSPIGVTHMVR